MKTLYRFRPLVHSIEWNDSRKKTLLFILYIILSLVSFAADGGSAEAPAAGQTQKTLVNEALPAIVAQYDEWLPAGFAHNNKNGICFNNINIQPNTDNGATGFLPVRPRNDQNRTERNLFSALRQKPACILPR